MIKGHSRYTFRLCTYERSTDVALEVRAKGQVGEKFEKFGDNLGDNLGVIFSENYQTQ